MDTPTHSEVMNQVHPGNSGRSSRRWYQEQNWKHRSKVHPGDGAEEGDTCDTARQGLEVLDCVEKELLHPYVRTGSPKVLESRSSRPQCILDSSSPDLKRDYESKSWT